MAENTPINLKKDQEKKGKVKKSKKGKEKEDDAANIFKTIDANAKILEIKTATRKASVFWIALVLIIYSVTAAHHIFPNLD